MIASDKKALVFALLAVLCWSTVATAFELALAGQSRFQLLFFANLSSVLVMAVVLFFQRSLGAALRGWAHWRMALASALINPLLYYLVLFQAYELLPAQVAQPINYTWAITLSLASVVVLRQRLTWRDLAAIITGYVGVLVVSLGGWRSGLAVPLSGVLLAFLSTFMWAGYWLLNTRDTRPPVVALTQNFMVALPFTAGAFWWFDPTPNFSLQALAASAYVGIFEMGLAFVFWLLALKNASRVGAIASMIFISPFLSLILIHFVLREPVSWLTLTGLGLLVLGLSFNKAHSSQ